MGILNKLNYRKHTRTLRTLDFENMDPKQMAETGRSESGRLSDQMYEGATMNPNVVGGTGPVEEKVAHQPMPDEKPDPRAQWDDVEGRWIIWNLETEQWEPLG